MAGRVAVFVVLVLASCGASVAQRPIPPLSNRGAGVYCFTGEVIRKGKRQTGEGCFSTLWLCQSARRSALRFGGLAGITAVSTCTKKWRF